MSDLDGIVARLDQLAELLRERTRSERVLAERRQTVQRECSAGIAKLQAELELPVDAGDLDGTLTAIARFRDQAVAAVATAALRRRRALREDLEHQIAQVAESEDPGDVSLRIVSLQKRRQGFINGVAKQRQRVRLLAESIAASARRCGVAAPTADEVAAMPLPADPEQGLEAVRIQLGLVETDLGRLLRRPAVKLAMPVGLIAAHLSIALPHLLAVAAFAYVIKPLAGWVPWIGLSAVACMAILTAIVAIIRWQLKASLAVIARGVGPLDDALDRLEERGRHILDAGAISQRSDKLLLNEAEKAARIQTVQGEGERAANRIREREVAAKERLNRRAAAAGKEAKRQHYEAGAGRLARLRTELAAAEAELSRRVAELDAAAATERAAMAAAAATWLDGSRNQGAATTRRLRAAHPIWTDGAAWADWKPTGTWGGEAPLGTLSATLDELTGAGTAEGEGGDFDSAPAMRPAVGPNLASRLGLDGAARLEYPVALGFPEPGSLLVRCRPDSREAGLRVLVLTALRALAGFPPGRVRLTLIDPVGLGQSFARLLDLAEHDEAVLSGGVLAEPGRIERGLDDLSAHLEKVIQKHLRGRYETLDDYNREAGELQEAMRLVLIADCPAGLGERSLERIGVLLRSGARCGVHLLVLHDDRQALPAALDPAWFHAHGLVLRLGGSRATLDRTGLGAFRFIGESEPPPALASKLVATIGSAAAKAKRVAVAFAAIAPSADQRWSGSTAEVLRLPIGKRGADRLQYLELGRGTAQHVLVGGRTGSGKSTLFHVMIASAALWYHPRELELHLIDFKKGVEFKAYATHRLPHAKVVAIESDREFGLSVLRQLDGELARRGDLFRQAGAQDLAAHRRTKTEHLPRILLIIDEFQEIFTEDDAIARDAALLLDRFVRQGRAFGLHVILGSQTLGGAYSLAKSSLGQMGVRIVLPCNEADANLLLHEENGAARLLSRPGDAIYNDQAGLIEGNSPFQVCWLSDAEEAEHLRNVAATASQAGWKQPRQVVFEGDGPSRIDDEAELLALAERPWQAGDARLRAWIGQASSLRGSAEVVFPGAAGGNLLIVGQHRDAAIATCAAITLGLAARHQVGKIRLITLDGEDGDGPCAQLHARLAAALPHQPQRREARDAATVVAELAAELDRRQSGSIPSTGDALVPVVLTVSALQRLRALRPDDDGGLGGGRGETPADAFARLLANGPEYGIHIIAWCDGLASLQRSLGRRALRDFEQRIAFQMSASDSSELLDDDGASRLGLHNALLLALGEGRRDKFRPYRIPDGGFLERFGGLLRQRCV
ncbi:hypothetical protein LBMAG53_05450 [Planctomycetota bacterium]|nr:hypothetical protein LBMAG53_05450 [Planctomycetota bacterium]